MIINFQGQFQPISKSYPIYKSCKNDFSKMISNKNTKINQLVNFIRINYQESFQHNLRI